MPSLSVLPPELLCHISSFLAANNADLATLARVNTKCSAVAQRLLYLHLSLNVAANSPLPTLANNPGLAALVSSFSLSIPYRNDLLASALANMSHLAELDIFVDSSQHLATCSILRNSSPYPLLSRFATSLPWNEDLIHFLHSCPTITQLYLDSPSISHLPLPPSFLPSLSYFTGPPSLALLLIPQRPVQHIDLTSSHAPTSNSDFQGLTPSLALSLSQSSAPVLALAATTSSTQVHPFPQQNLQPQNDEDLVTVLRVLASCMGHLRHLRVVTNTYAASDTFGFQPGVFDNTYFENITDALTSLPELQSCEIWGFHWISSKNSKNDDHSSSPSSSLTSTCTPSSSNTWHSPSVNTNTIIPTSTSTTSNFLDDLYQDLIFPY